MSVKPAMILCGLVLLGTSPVLGSADEPRIADASAREFESTTLPLVKKYCLECHSADEQEGEVDLERFARFDQVRNAPRVWQKVGEVLDKHEMPPKEAKQPDAAERTQLQRWVKEFLAVEAKRRAGDPGRVILRRLNNAEYTYTIRDLTGLATLEPAREFPVDGAAGEGFTNTGNALVMSPSLVTKYLDAAKQVADHAVLLPEGFRFAPGTTSRDWTEETLAKIRDFYRQFTDPKSGGEQVNLQGIIFETNQGGAAPARTLPAGHHRRASRVERRVEDDRGRRRRTRAEPEVSGNPLASLERGRTFAPGEWPSDALESREGGGSPGARGRGDGLAKGTLEVFQRRPHRQSQRTESLDGAGQPAGREP